MFENEKNFEIKLGNEVLKVNTGRIARQAGGAVLLTCGKTTILATATRSKDVKPGQDFFPLTVDYIEKFYASGKFPGGFVKRESKPSTEEILISRLVDRPIRPLFPESFLNAVHVVINTVSYDGVNMPENLATIGASLALGISDIPFEGPVAGVTVGYIDGEYVLNPNKEQQEVSKIYLSVAGTMDAITMVEAWSNEVSEDEMLDAIMFGHEQIKQICKGQKEIIDEIGQEVSKIYLSVAGTMDAITMVEAWSNEVSEDEMLDAIMFGHEQIKQICKGQKEIIDEIGQEKLEVEEIKFDEKVVEFLDGYKKELKKSYISSR